MLDQGVVAVCISGAPPVEGISERAKATIGDCADQGKHNEATATDRDEADVQQPAIQWPFEHGYLTQYRGPLAAVLARVAHPPLHAGLKLPHPPPLQR